MAIGTHDLSTLTPPFTYEVTLPPLQYCPCMFIYSCIPYQARVPTAIEFVPLSQSATYKADALLEFYRSDSSVKHIKPFTDIIYSSPVYPVSSQVLPSPSVHTHHHFPSNR